MMLLNLTKRPLKRGPLKARKSPQPVKAWFQKWKRKKSREALRKAEVVVKVLQRRTSSHPLADLQEWFPVLTNYSWSIKHFDPSITSYLYCAFGLENRCRTEWAKWTTVLEFSLELSSVLTIHHLFWFSNHKQAGSRANSIQNTFLLLIIIKMWLRFSKVYHSNLCLLLLLFVHLITTSQSLRNLKDGNANAKVCIGAFCQISFWQSVFHSPSSMIWSQACEVSLP